MTEAGLADIEAVDPKRAVLLGQLWTLKLAQSTILDTACRILHVGRISCLA